MKILKLLFFPSLLMLVFLTGCSTQSVVKEDVEVLSSERLINKLEVNRRRVRNFEGSGNIEIKTKQMENSASFNTVIIKPDSMKLDINGPFGIELANILVTKKNFIFYQSLSNTAYKGEISEDVLKQIFKVDIKFNDLLDAFSGSVNLSDKLYRKPDDFKVVDDEYIISYDDSSADVRTIYKIGIRDLGIREYSLVDFDGKDILKCVNSKFKLVETVPIPQTTEVIFFRNKDRIKIDYDKFRINNKQLFIEFNIPDDADVLKW